ncbi:hypothetical protein [Salaquimonas pukyongi]|uniref:hypothetical protein n=1 Tax=Salaquimonas pukyongi TaxID=2712698 RepID=UPI0012EB2982|nr:hypothetical protein [Salaquimonas pukyongi]
MNAADVLDSQQFEERFSGQAVSALNGKVEAGGFHVSFDSDDDVGESLQTAEGYMVKGALSLPLGSRFGLQIDAGGLQGNVETDGLAFASQTLGIEAYGLGGQLFWRDPQIGLLGLYGQQTRYDLDDIEITHTRFGLMGEAYLGDFTLKGFAGRDMADFGFFGEGVYWAATGEVDFYITDDLMVKAGIEHSFNTTSAFAGVEAMFTSGKIASSLFAEASFSKTETRTMAGIRFYIGQQAKSLKRRHREDDPEVDLFGDLNAIGNCLNGVTAPPEEMLPLPAVGQKISAPVGSAVPMPGLSIPKSDPANCDVDYQPVMALP